MEFAETKHSIGIRPINYQTIPTHLDINFRGKKKKRKEQPLKRCYSNVAALHHVGKRHLCPNV